MSILQSIRRAAGGWGWALLLAGLAVGCLGEGLPTAALPSPENDLPADQFPVRIAGGAASARLGPGVAMMDFTAGYRFGTDESPVEGSQYVWIIVRKRGDSVEKILPMGRSGEIHVLAKGWIPQDGPFVGYMERIAPNGSRTRVSQFTPMPLEGEPRTDRY